MQIERRTVRLTAAAASAAMALIYFLIGLGVLSIGGSTSGETVDLAMFGYSAGTAFLILAALLFRTDRRWLWVLAALFQVWVYVIYFAVAPGRQPPFEIWGATLRVIQLVLFAGLLYLSWNAPEHKAKEVTP
jgi:4-amino-4-deoxy-L-arabinose transferase-like glycosyltransferase